jgi:PAS domain S-box-containing protein
MAADRQEAVTLTDEAFRLFVGGVQDYAIFMLDPTGVVTTWNAGAERLKGWRAAEIVGQHFSVFYPPDVSSSGHPDRELERAAAQGRYEEEAWRVRKDGSRFWANVIIMAVRDADGRVLGFAKVTRDMTEQRASEDRLAKANEELVRADAMRTELLATTAHELANPIMVIGGYAQTLRRQWDDLEEDARTHALDSILRQVDNLTRLASDLGTASHLEAGGLEVTTELVSLANSITGAIESLPGRDMDIAVTCPEGLAVRAEEARLRQILTNYLYNALRYGAPPISVEARATDGWVEIRVKDTGPGVSEAFMPRLFQKFERDATASRTVRGSGLGLFIVSGLAEAMGGSVWYEANQPHGACFGVRLPAV